MKKQLGGIARRATLINQQREKGEVLLVDGGDFGGYKEPSLWETTEFEWEMMTKMGYDAVTPGPNEMLQGLGKLKALVAQGGPKMVSANVTDKSGNLILPEYTVITKGGVRYGITGVTSESFYNYNVTKGDQVSDDFAFKDINQTLRDVLPKVKKESDITVVLMHVGPGDARRIVDEIPGMDVVLVGHNPGYMFNPDRVGETLMLRPGTKGQYISVLELSLDDSNKIVDFSGEGKPIGKEIEESKDFFIAVTEFEETLKKAKREEEREKAAKDASVQGTDKYVGAEMCGRCHMDEYTRWSETPHAHAYESLVKDQKAHVDECIACHVVGFGEPGGYTYNAEFDSDGHAKKIQDSVMLRNVQCESCHGMGTFHGTAAMVSKPGEESCVTCHDGVQTKPLNYEKALAEGFVH